MVLIAFLLFRDHSLPESNPSRRTQELYYNVGHTFEVALTGPDSQELLSALSLQDLVAIYTNEAGERIVSGSPQTPLKLTFSIVSGKYQCKLSGKQVYIEAYHSPF